MGRPSEEINRELTIENLSPKYPLRRVTNYYISGSGLHTLKQEVSEQALLAILSLSGMFNYALPAYKLAREHPDSILSTGSQRLDEVSCIVGTIAPAMGVLYLSTKTFLEAQASGKIPEVLQTELTTSASRLKDAAIFTGSAISSIPLALVIFGYPLPLESPTAALVATGIVALIVELDNTALHFLPFLLAMKSKICRFPVVPFEILARKIYRIVRKPPAEVTNTEAEEIRTAVSAYLEYVKNRMIIKSVFIRPKLTYRWDFHGELKAKIFDAQQLIFTLNKPKELADNVVYLYQENAEDVVKYVTKNDDGEITGEIKSFDLPKRHYTTCVNILKNSRETQEPEEVRQQIPVVSYRTKKAILDLLSKRGHIELDYLAALAKQFPPQHIVDHKRYPSVIKQVMGIAGGVLVLGGCAGYLMAPFNLFNTWTGSPGIAAAIVATPVYFLSVLLTFLGYMFGKNIYYNSTHWGENDAKLPLEFKLYPKTFTCLMLLNLYLNLYSYAAAEQVIRDNFQAELFDYIREPLIWIARVGLPFLGVNTLKDLSAIILRKVAIHCGDDATQFTASLMTSIDQMVRALSAAKPETLVNSQQYLVDLGILEQSQSLAEEPKPHPAPQKQGCLDWFASKVCFWQGASNTSVVGTQVNIEPTEITALIQH